MEIRGILAFHKVVISLFIVLVFAGEVLPCDLQITCEPGVRIFINDEFKGVTKEEDKGMFIEGLVEGTYLVEAIRRNGGKFTISIAIEEGDDVKEVRIPKSRRTRKQETENTEQGSGEIENRNQEENRKLNSEAMHEEKPSDKDGAREEKYPAIEEETTEKGEIKFPAMSISLTGKGFLGLTSDSDGGWSFGGMFHGRFPTKLGQAWFAELGIMVEYMSSGFSEYFEYYSGMEYMGFEMGDFRGIGVGTHDRLVFSVSDGISLLFEFYAGANFVTDTVPSDPGVSLWSKGFTFIGIAFGMEINFNRNLYIAASLGIEMDRLKAPFEYSNGSNIMGTDEFSVMDFGIVLRIAAGFRFLEL